jgi:pimeloyl-ACP methyl ester carboxylesterase
MKATDRRDPEAVMSEHRPPVVFIHGLWIHATSWQPWVELFDQHGYRSHAPGWPGVRPTVAEARQHPDDIADHGIDDVVKRYLAFFETLPAKPIVVGHSFGGMITEKLLGINAAAAGIAIDAAQIKGVLPLPLSALRSTLPVFKNPANRHKAVSLSDKQFRYAFANAVPEDESTMLFEKWAIPAPGRPLFEAAAANFSLHSPAAVDTANSDRGPLLLVMGGRDHTVPETITKSTLRQYRGSNAVSDLLEFKDRGHSLTIDNGWREVADGCLEWLEKQGLNPAATA